MTAPIPPKGGGVQGEEAAEPTDESLFRAFSEGRSHAFDVLVARYGNRIRAYIGQLVRDAASADDLTQNVFVKLLRRAQDGPPWGEADPELIVWLLRVARNECIDQCRRRAAHLRLLEAVRAGVGRYAAFLARRPAQPDQSMEQAEFHHRLQAALRGLPEPLMSAFLLRERDGLSYEEIAMVMGCPAKTVSSRLFRARMQLREAMGPESSGFPGAEQ